MNKSFIVVFSCLVAMALGVPAQPGQFQSIDILSQPGCDAAATLVPNMQDCVLHQLMGSNGTLTMTFTVGAKPKHSILLTLRSVGGMAEMYVVTSVSAVRLLCLHNNNVCASCMAQSCVTDQYRPAAAVHCLPALAFLRPPGAAAYLGVKVYIFPACRGTVCSCLTVTGTSHYCWLGSNAVHT